MIGALNRRVTLRMPVRTEDDGGGAEIAYASAGDVWARIETPSAADADIGAARGAAIKHRMTIRFRTDVGPDWRVLWGEGREARIVAARDEDGARRFLELDCEEERQ